MHDTAIATDGYFALAENLQQPLVANPDDLSQTAHHLTTMMAATTVEERLTEPLLQAEITDSESITVTSDLIKAQLAGIAALPPQNHPAGAQLTDELTGQVMQTWSMGHPGLTVGGNNYEGSSDSFDPLLGYGTVDAAAAVAAARSSRINTAATNPGGQDWGLDLLNVPDVWNAGLTGEGVVVAVIDSGVDITHPDLAANAWINVDEIDNDGIDNDRNGYIDDVFGWNFESGQADAMVLPGTMNPGQDHGTHVAGIIAAEQDGVGITGVAHDAQIMPLRLGDVGVVPGGAIAFTNGGSLAEAIYYAVDNGADVINLSLGSTPSAALEQALAYAASHQVFVVSSAGNSGARSPGFPASYAVNDGISVGAIDASGHLADFSNQAGLTPAMRHVVAPGVDIYSTLPNGQYGFKNGTSMAAPYITGVVALMLDANPNLTVDEIGTILTETAVQDA